MARTLGTAYLVFWQMLSRPFLDVFVASRNVIWNHHQNSVLLCNGISRLFTDKIDIRRVWQSRRMTQFEVGDVSTCHARS